MTALTFGRKAGFRRIVASLTFVAVAFVGGAIVLHNHDAAVQHDTLDAVTNSKIAAYVPPAKHVFVINIENKGFTNTWGDGVDGNGYGIGAGNGGDPYLATTLRSKGALLTSYYGTAHNSEPNYIAQLSGQGPNPEMQGDCQTYSNFVSAGTAAMHQLRGTGCIFPKGTASLAMQLQNSRHTWKGYEEDMATPCQHPTVGGVDNTQKATATSEYATRHNPFMYFHDIIDNPTNCAAHVVPLTQLSKDLSTYGSTPEYSLITPDLCNDGHDAPCANGQPGGLKSIDAWMKVWVPRIMASPAFKTDGVLVITADEADYPGSDNDITGQTACCGETAVNTPKAGITNDGGGLIGALVISKWTKPGSWSSTPYNHYALLASLEDIFRLGYAGYASDPNLDHFGLDVYNSGWDQATPSPTPTPTPVVTKQRTYIGLTYSHEVLPVGQVTRETFAVHPASMVTGTLKVSIIGPGVNILKYINLTHAMGGVVSFNVKPTGRGSIAVKAQYYGDSACTPSSISRYFNVR
ncbi:hypothetical protein Back2_25330 [Nocardioides baekrokdamisoli]|uniref:Phosphoesterase n=1 Tax=Nocardioides baekrokdamisoli TaxID=1804624 RepID=A0A3G9IIQ4_9ACTN|nr:alkaline phosphatase family protein [Nocardioides baekrokdamisoli]BBH18246.1 hypothetical protein Back2_25330 [Nocardioides baekrokdamisoli]